MAVAAPVTGGSHRTAAARVIELMRRDLAAPHRLDDLARAALFSPYHFHRVFTDVTGTSPARFLTRLRIAESRRLLLRTDRPVNHISTAVGYHSLGTFTSQFTRLVGEPPGAFRRLARAAVGGCPAPCPGPTTAVLSATGSGGEHRWVLWHGPGRSPVTLPVGEHRVRALVVRPGRAVVDALVDGDPDSYLVAGGVITVDAGPSPAVRWFGRRRPAATDLPLLAAQPLREFAGWHS